MKPLNVIAFVLLVILGSSCATNVLVRVPYAQLESPDVTGTNGKFHMGFNAAPGKEINVIDDASSRPPVFNQSYEETSLEPSFRAGVGLLNLMDLSFQYGLTNVPLVKLKWQVLGSTMTAAADNDFLFAIYGRVGATIDNEDGDQRALFGDGGYPWKGKANIGVSGLGASIGYRFPGEFMVYLGGAYDNYRGSAKVSQSISADGSSPAGEYSEAHKGYSRSAGLGLKWGHKSAFGVYGQATQFRWGGLNSYDDIQGGVEYTIALD